MTISSDSKELVYLVMSLDFAVYFHLQNTTLLPDEKRGLSSLSKRNFHLVFSCGKLPKSGHSHCMEIALWPASIINLPAKISVYKTISPFMHVPPLQPLATGTIPKLDR